MRVSWSSSSMSESDSSEEFIVRSPDPVSASVLCNEDADSVKVSLFTDLILLTFLKILFTFLVVDFLSSFGGVSSMSVSVRASESLSVSGSESLVFLALVGDFLAFSLLPLFLLFRSVLTLLSLLSFLSPGFPNFFQQSESL